MARIKPVIDATLAYEGVGFGLDVFGYGSQITQGDFGGSYRADVSVGDPGSISRPRISVPALRVLPQSAPTGHPDSATPRTAEEVLPSPADVIDPEFRPTATVYEDAPGGIYETNRAPTDWAEVYRQYVILNAPEETVFHDTIDWGEAVGTILGGVLDPFGVGQYARAALSPPTTVTGIPSLGQQTILAPARTAMVTAAGCPPLGPRYAKICLATNEITPLRRRRRRRLLTSSDIKDLAALKAIVGGAALQGAVVQAIRR